MNNHNPNELSLLEIDISYDTYGKAHPVCLTVAPSSQRRETSDRGAPDEYRITALKIQARSYFIQHTGISYPRASACFRGAGTTPSVTLKIRKTRENCSAKIPQTHPI